MYNRLILLLLTSPIAKLLLTVLVYVLLFMFYKYLFDTYTLTKAKILMPSESEIPFKSKEQKEILPIQEIPYIKDDSYTPSNNLDDYFTNYDEFCRAYETSKTSPSIVDTDFIIQQDPLFVVENNTLPPTTISPPPVLDNQLPFEAPVTITVSEEPTNDNRTIIDYLTQSQIQQDQRLSIYSPSYIGDPNSSDIHRLHLDIVEIVSQDLRQQQMEFMSQEDMKRIIHDTVKRYMIDYNIYSTITFDSLRNTQHILNLLIDEMIVNSMFVDDYEKFLLHNICKTLISEVICYVEHTSNFQDDYRVEQIIQRFLPSHD